VNHIGDALKGASPIIEMNIKCNYSLKIKSFCIDNTKTIDNDIVLGYNNQN